MKILVPIDGSKYAMEAVKMVSDMARATGAQVALMTVTPSIADIDIEYTARERESLEKKVTAYAERALEEAQKVLSAAGISPKTSVVSSNSVSDAIITTAKKGRFDIIAIGSRGLGATARIILGGVASRVVNHAPCSVLVVRMEK
ncbi:MAG: universal stress protein [Desulfovibrionales bacterium]|nr:universal stress protein [Desulfovibrionales bacterium]